jgi:hypothetical protein
MKPSGDSIDGPEFTSTAFSGYHLEGWLPGGSPTSHFYWLLDVFVYITGDLTSEKSIQEAIADMESYGRQKGLKRFNAVLTSITHVILLRVTEDSVQHTKRLRMIDAETSSNHDRMTAGSVLMRRMNIAIMEKNWMKTNLAVSPTNRKISQNWKRSWLSGTRRSHSMFEATARETYVLCHVNMWQTFGESHYSTFSLTKNPRQTKTIYQCTERVP